MTVSDHSAQNRGAAHRLTGPLSTRRPTVLHFTSAALLGLAAALLVACGSSGKGLIPTGDAGPLQSDFEAVARAAENGDGSCAATAEAIRKTEQDFGALPASVDAGLRGTLEKGITDLRSRALSLCAQPLAQTTTTSASPPPTTHTQSTTTTTPTITQTTSTQTTPTTTPTISGPGGGTPAPTPEVSPGASGGPQGGTGEENAGGASGAGSGDGRSGGGVGPGQEAGK